MINYVRLYLLLVFNFFIHGGIYINKLSVLFGIFIVSIAISGCDSGVQKNNHTESNTVLQVEEDTNNITATTQTTQSAQQQTDEAHIENQNEYNISIDVNPETNEVNGIEKIKFKNRTELKFNKIYFNTYLNAFSRGSENKPYFDEFKNKVFKYGESYGYMDIMNVSMNNEDLKFTLDGTILCVELDEPLNQEATAEITIQFHAKIPKICHRTGSNDKAMWFGNFLPTLAVYDSDGWHTENYYPAGEPFYGRISNYNVKISTPKDYKVIGSGESQVSVKEDKSITTFKTKMSRDFAFAVSKNFEKSTKTSKLGIDINFYHYSNIKDIDTFLDTAANSIDYYSSVIGTYPYESLDIVETELFISGGMEYPQIIFMDSEYLKNEASYKTLSHEIAHQWYYNIIGNNQIKYAWLDEGMSNFIQDGVFYDNSQIKDKMETEYNNLKNKLPQLELKKLDTSTKDYSTWFNYYNIQYVKSKLMIYSLKLKMGDIKFNEFLKTYYSKYSFKVVTKEDFISTAEDIYGSELKQFFNDWLEGEELPPLK